MADDRHMGIYNKYVVRRVGDSDGKHQDCDYFVLDWDHDPYAVAAARAYAEGCAAEYPKLAGDLRARANVEEARWVREGRLSYGKPNS
jgi:hypothetical protein